MKKNHLKDEIKWFQSLLILTTFISCLFHQNLHAQTWTQQGTDILNVTGGSISLSDDGKRMAIGSSQLDNNGNLKVYQYINNNWIQLGSTLYGAAFNDMFGVACSLSGDGNSLIVGANGNDENGIGSGEYKVYSWNGNSWIQKGSDINGEAAYDGGSAKNVTISSDGNCIAIGSPQPALPGTGKVRVFQWNGTTWIQKGITFYGANIYDFFGTSVSLNGNGNILTIGASQEGNSGNGQCFVYEWTGNSWTQKGPTLIGPATGSEFGCSTALSADGNIVSVGARGAGQVFVYEWNTNTWTLKGNSIGIQNITNYFGFSVSLANDGNTIAIGAPNDNQYAGKVKVFEFNMNNWLQKGFDIDGTENQFGYSSDISGNGTTIAAGAPGNGIGLAKAYYFCSSNSTTDIQTACDSYTWTNGITYNSSNNSASQTLLTTEGCDSIVNLNLTILNSTTSTDYMTTCDSYTWMNGITYTTSNTNATYIIPNSVGCDSVISLNLIITNNASIVHDTICGGPYYWNGISYSQSGTYTQTLNAINNCDSTVTLHLIVYPNNFNPSFSSNQQLFTAPPFAVQFSNNTPNPSNYTFTWFWGDGTSTTSNTPNVFHQYLNNGLYTVTLQATNLITGCTDDTTLVDYIFTTGGISCTHTAAINQTGPISACSGQSVVLSCNSSPSFTYQWRRNGVYISGNNNDSLLVTQPGAYSVIISDNGCPVSSTEIVVNFSNILTPTISASGAIQPCIGGSVVLTSSPGYTSYLWSNGSTNQSTTITNSGNYTVQVTNALGCTATSSIYSVNASILPTQNICVVGVDSVTNNLRVVWEKPITTAIDSFYVYKETNVSNVYSKVGARLYDSLSVWIDPVSNPAVQAYRYKITALDTCGVETPLSDFHKSIHLTINQGVGGAWNLIWSHYEGLSFGSYNIYRGSAPNNLTLLTSIQSTLNSYTDLTPPVGDVYYQIEIVNPNNCNPTKVVNYSSSKSNVVTNAAIGLTELHSNIILYPNPTENFVTVEGDFQTIKNYIILDGIGKKISSGSISIDSNQIDLSEFSKGAYLIVIEGLNKPFQVIKN